MIIDLEKFVAAERPHWTALERFLNQLEKDPGAPVDLASLKKFHYLYERASADLAKIQTFSSEPELHRYLESLVARAYAEIHEIRGKAHRFEPWKWFWQGFPNAFRRHWRAFQLSMTITLVGALFGGLALAMDREAKSVLMPFSHLQMDPRERVAQEEKTAQGSAGGKAPFSTFLMTHNTKVSILTMALGSSWGVGTTLLLFYNGVILGAVAADYLLAGCGVFLFGWLLPHGSIEIPAILIAGQAGLVLANAFIGWGNRNSFRTRLRLVSPDLVFLIFGVAVLLIWAGLIEAFFSQYHHPILPYWLKISFGTLELIGLVLFLSMAGKNSVKTPV